MLRWYCTVGICELNISFCMSEGYMIHREGFLAFYAVVFVGVSLDPRVFKGFASAFQGFS